jgi:hypothetical protein
VPVPRNDRLLSGEALRRMAFMTQNAAGDDRIGAFYILSLRHERCIE